MHRPVEAEINRSSRISPSIARLYHERVSRLVDLAARPRLDGARSRVLLGRFQCREHRQPAGPGVAVALALADARISSAPSTASSASPPTSRSTDPLLAVVPQSHARRRLPRAVGGAWLALAISVATRDRGRESSSHAAQPHRQRGRRRARLPGRGGRARTRRARMALGPRRHDRGAAVGRGDRRPAGARARSGGGRHGGVLWLTVPVAGALLVYRWRRSSSSS